jgi:hypothetical protein
MSHNKTGSAESGMHSTPEPTNTSGKGYWPNCNFTGLPKAKKDFPFLTDFKSMENLL